MVKHIYFPHDGNAMSDEKLLMLRSEYGGEGYGVFWMLLESMFMASNGRINRGAIGGLSLGYGVAKERILKIVDYCVSIGLLKESQDKAISSPRMDSHLAMLESFRESGKAGAEKRWSTSHPNRGANGGANANKSKVNESIVNKTTTVVFEKSFLRWLNQQGKKENYARWIVDNICPIEVVKKAWTKVLGGKSVSSPSDFVELCKTLHNS